MLHAWGKSDPRTFGWYEAPPAESLDAAERLLAMLGALTDESEGKITPLGERLLSLPVHPRLGRLLIGAADQGLAAQGAAIAALLSEKDIIRPAAHDPHSLHRPANQGRSDLLVRLDILNRRDHAGSNALDVDGSALRQTARVRDELLRLTQRLAGNPRNRRGSADEDELLKLPPLAYPDRVARRRGSDYEAAVMVGGGVFVLSNESCVKQAEFFVALDARQDQRRITREAMVRVASEIKVEWLEELFPQLIRREQGVMFDVERQRVIGFTAVYYRDLLSR